MAQDSQEVIQTRDKIDQNLATKIANSVGKMLGGK